MSDRSSVRFSLGTGVNFNPYLHKADLALASIIFDVDWNSKGNIQTFVDVLLHHNSKREQNNNCFIDNG